MGTRTAWMRIGLIVGFTLLVGVVASLVWAGVTTLPRWVVQPDGHATITDAELTQTFSADFWFALVGAASGLILGTASWAALRRVGWPVVAVAVGASLFAGLLCIWIAQWFGPGPFPTRLAAATAGDTVSDSLRLRSPSALAVWAFTAAMVPLFSASLGPEVDRRDRAEEYRAGRPEELAEPAHADEAS